MSEKPDIFSRFGGVRALAAAIGEPPSTVQSWKAVGRIPAGRPQRTVILVGPRFGIDVTADDVVWPLGRTGADVAHSPSDSSTKVECAPGKCGDLAAPVGARS